MATKKSALELIREAAKIVVGLDEMLLEKDPKHRETGWHQAARDWLASELDEESLHSEPSSAAEPATDARWFELYLKGAEVFGRYLSARMSEPDTADAKQLSKFAKTFADAGLAHARQQAKESLDADPSTK